jgi:hypothetical protein
MPVSANTAAKPAVNVLSRSRIRNRNWVARSPRSMSAEVQEQVAGLLGHPGAGGMGGDPGDVHAAAAVLDHSQDVEAAEEDGVDVGEVDRKDLVGLRGEQPSAGRSGPYRRRFDAGGRQDFPDGGGGDRVAESEKFTVDSPVAPGGGSRGPCAAPGPGSAARWVGGLDVVLGRSTGGRLAGRASAAGSWVTPAGAGVAAWAAA